MNLLNQPDTRALLQKSGLRVVPKHKNRGLRVSPKQLIFSGLVVLLMGTICKASSYAREFALDISGHTKIRLTKKGVSFLRYILNTSVLPEATRLYSKVKCDDCAGTGNEKKCQCGGTGKVKNKNRSRIVHGYIPEKCLKPVKNTPCPHQDLHVTKCTCSLDEDEVYYKVSWEFQGYSDVKPLVSDCFPYLIDGEPLFERMSRKRKLRENLAKLSKGDEVTYLKTGKTHVVVTDKADKEHNVLIEDWDNDHLFLKQVAGDIKGLRGGTVCKMFWNYGAFVEQKGTGGPLDRRFTNPTSSLSVGKSMRFKILNILNTKGIRRRRRLAERMLREIRRAQNLA